MAIHTCEGMHHRFVVGPGEPVVCPHCELVTLRAQLAAWTDASQCGHPNPCTLGSLCPYCEIGRLRAQLADCRADAERLDKLQDLFIKGDEFHIVMCAGENDDEECEHDAHPHFEAFDWSWRCEAVRSNTLRDVIDQAIDKARHD